MKRTLFLVAAVSLLGLGPKSANAQDQPWLADRRYTEGIGIRVGDFELHPGLAAEFGYDSNFFRRAEDELGGPVGALRLRITPSFSISTLSRQRREATDAPPPDVELRAGIAATYNEFFPVSGPELGQELMKDQRNVGGTADILLALFPGRPWSGNLFADVTRTITPSPQGITGSSFNRLTPRAGGELIWTPGGGLLDWRLGYRFGATVFESSDFTGLTHLEHSIETRGRWRFLPRTALMYDARFGFIDYPSPFAGPIGKTGSHPVRMLLGMNGLITPSFGLMALAGWGASFYQPTGQEDFDSIIGRAEVKWYLTPNPSTDPMAATLALSSLSIGYVRDFFDSYIGTYFGSDRGYVNFSYFFGGRFLLVAEGGVAAIQYPVIAALGANDPFTDVRVDATLFGEYRFADRFGVNLTGRYGQNFSRTEVNVTDPDTGTTVSDPLSWQQIEAYLGLRFLM